MMRVLVTGSSGMIGRWTCDLLHRQGHQVLGIDLRPAPDAAEPWRHAHCDLLQADALAAIFFDFQPEGVIHLAARTDLEGRKLADYAVNTDGVANLLTAVLQSPATRRAIYTSSQLVCAVGHVPRHDQDFCPNTIYGESKVETERLVRTGEGGGVSWCLARPTTVWGPHMNEHYRSLLRHIENRRYFHSGTGALYKSYSYAGNIAHQYVQLLLAGKAQIHGKVFYMADYEPLSLRDYVNALADELEVRRPVTVPLPLARLIALAGDGLNALGLRFPYNSFRLRNIRTEYIFDMHGTKAVCGPLPYDLQQGVRETVKWHREAP